MHLLCVVSLSASRQGSQFLLRGRRPEINLLQLRRAKQDEDFFLQSRFVSIRGLPNRASSTPIGHWKVWLGVPLEVIEPSAAWHRRVAWQYRPRQRLGPAQAHVSWRPQRPVFPLAPSHSASSKSTTACCTLYLMYYRSNAIRYTQYVGVGGDEVPQARELRRFRSPPLPVSPPLSLRGVAPVPAVQMYNTGHCDQNA